MQRATIPGCTRACLAIEAALIQVPAVPDHHKRHMAAELETFVRQVQKRSVEAVERASRVTPSRTTLTLSFSDVLRRAGVE